MGGNSFALDLQTKEIKSFAEKIDLSKISRIELINSIRKILDILNLLYNQKFDQKLFNTFSLNMICGSSKHLFDKNLSNTDILKYKPLFGDIDILIDNEKIPLLWKLLKTIENKPINNIEYIGQNKKEIPKQQINSIWKINGILIQFDFIGIDFSNDWAIFMKQSSWEDVKNGIKSVFHKLLLRAYVREKFKEDGILLTPKSSIKNLRIAKNQKLNKYSISHLGLAERIRKVGFESKDLFKEIPKIYIIDKNEIENIIGKIPESFIDFCNIIKNEPNKLNIFKEFVILCFGYDILKKEGIAIAQSLERVNLDLDKNLKLNAITYLLNTIDLTNSKELFRLVTNDAVSYYYTALEEKK